MKAIVLHEYGPPANLKYEDWDDPKPGAGEVLVAIHAASVNPIDWKLRSGAYKDRMPLQLPVVLGRDLAGAVRKVGEGVTEFSSGDAVMAFANGTYAQLSIVKAADLVRIPEGMETTLAAAIPLVAITGDQLTRDAAKVQPGQTVLVAGALGSVGRMATFAAHEIGAKVIAGVRTKQLDQARKLPGVVDAVALDDDAALAKLDKVDAVANTLLGDVTAKLIATIKEGGIFGSVADVPPNAADFPTIQVNRIQAKLNAGTIAHYAKAVQDGKLELPIDRVLPLIQVAEAHALGEKGGTAGKLVLTVEINNAA